MVRRSVILSLLGFPWVAWAQKNQSCFDRFDRCFSSSGGGPSLDYNFLSGALPAAVNFSRASSGTYFDASGTLQTASTNVARFDHNPNTLAAVGLLIEESRTNLLLNNTTLSTQTVTVTAQAYTLSFYGTGTVVLSGAFVGTLAGSGAFPTRSTLTFTPSAGALICTVTGTVSYGQIEAGSFATSVIITAGASATRAVDVATLPTSAFAFNASVGSWAIQFQKAYASYYPGILDMTDGTNNNLQGQYINNSDNKLSFQAKVSNAYTISTIPSGVVSYGTTQRSAYSWSGSTVKNTLNGAAPSSGTGALPSGLTTILFGNDQGNYVNGWIARVRYWPRALSSAELQTVTT